MEVGLRSGLGWGVIFVEKVGDWSYNYKLERMWPIYGSKYDNSSQE